MIIIKKEYFQNNNIFYEKNEIATDFSAIIDESK